MTSKRVFFMLLGIFALSAILIVPFLHPRDILSDHPIYSDDYSMHFSNCLAAKHFWQNFGRGWGYDPFLLAGFPRCTLVDADNKAWEFFFMALSPFCGEGLAFKLYLLFFLLFYPFAIYASTRQLGLTKQESLAGSFLSILFFNLSVPNDLTLWGMLSYVIACFLSPFAIASFYRLFQRFSYRRYLAATACSAGILLVHVLGLMHVVVPAVLLYLLNARRLSLKQHLLIWLIPVLILAVNSFWLIPIFELFQDKTTRVENYNFTLQIKNIFEPLEVYLKQRRSQALHLDALNTTFFEIVTLLFGCSGIYHWYRKKRTGLALAFTGGILYIFCINFYGSHVPLFAQFQPQRFTVALNILLIIPAAIGALAAGRFLFSGKKPLTVFFILCLLFVVAYKPIVRPFALIYKYKLYRLNCEFPDPLTKLLTFLKNDTDSRGRILLEDSESKHSDNGTYYPEAYYGGHYPGLFPNYVKREFLCGPRPLYPVKHSFASFTRGLLFEKDIDRYTLEELQYYFTIYNVKWIVCWFEKSKTFFDRFPGYLKKIGDIDKFSVYEVCRAPSFFIRGSGTVRSGYNRLELNNIAPEKNEIVIGYHWMKHLKTTPPVPLERVMIGRDPIGFIRIKNPPASLVITNGY